jgi:hypothetical protein
MAGGGSFRFWRPAQDGGVCSRSRCACGLRLFRLFVGRPHRRLLWPPKFYLDSREKVYVVLFDGSRQRLAYIKLRGHGTLPS